jgi:protoporphyrinogen oxidase
LVAWADFGWEKKLSKFIVIGAGPAGLGAAYRLHELGVPDWHLFERDSHIGGLSSSFVDDAGFTWDVGGHVLFSHYDYFDTVVEGSLAGQYYEHMRESWVRILGGWVPYPFQNNVRYLPADARDFCVNGLKNLPAGSAANNFKEWMDAVFGEGIVKYFMDPYNRKVWATPPELMSKDWIAERVSVVDLARIERNIAEAKDDIAWGPNNMFKFPKRGGTGIIYGSIAKGFSGNVNLNHDLVEVDLEKKKVLFANGAQHSYDQLISTIPINQFVANCTSVPDEVRDAATQLVHNSVYVVGIGLKGLRDDTKCWMYFPEENCPFYRVTNFHNYSPYNVPDGDVDTYFALMCETSYSQYKPVSKDDIVERTIQGLINSGMLNESERDNIISRYLIDVPYAYPVPTMGRDEALAVIQPFLESHNVYSRGRFGAWKYEVGNMDHSFMQGVEVVGRILSSCDERTFHG